LLMAGGRLLRGGRNKVSPLPPETFQPIHCNLPSLPHTPNPRGSVLRAGIPVRTYRADVFRECDRPEGVPLTVRSI
jgi:hypothetical protein